MGGGDHNSGRARSGYHFTFVLDGHVRHVIWIADQEDSNDTVHTRTGQIVVADTRNSIEVVATADGFALEPGVEGDTPLDLDALAGWIDHGEDSDPDAVLILNAWNFLGDIGRSVGRPLNDRSAELDRIYQKVFAANNLPAVTPPGEHYQPLWASSELQLLRSILATGLAVAREELPHP